MAKYALQYVQNKSGFLFFLLACFAAFFFDWQQVARLTYNAGKANPAKLSLSCNDHGGHTWHVHNLCFCREHGLGKRDNRDNWELREKKYCQGLSGGASSNVLQPSMVEMISTADGLRLFSTDTADASCT